MPGKAMITKGAPAVEDVLALLDSAKDISTILRIGPQPQIGVLRKLTGQCLLLPGFRTDGVGIQAMLRICVMLLSRRVKATYIHVPFLSLAHQTVDAVSHSLPREQWLIDWERFLNLGRGEFHVTDLENAMGRKALAQALLDKEGQYGDPKDGTRERLPEYINQIRSGNATAKRLWVFNLGLCRQPKECQLFVDYAMVNELREKFDYNGYVPSYKVYDDRYLNIAIHIRRGDVWDACQAGSTQYMHVNKFVNQEYYVNLLEKLCSLFKTSKMPLCFHVFSDGEVANFDRFSFISDDEAVLMLDSGEVVKNLRFHLRSDTISTLYHMIQAPIFFPGKSTFSVLALIYGRSYVIYDDEITEFYQYDLLGPYMDSSPRFERLRTMTVHRAQEILDGSVRSCKNGYP